MSMWKTACCWPSEPKSDDERSTGDPGRPLSGMRSTARDRPLWGGKATSGSQRRPVRAWAGSGAADSRAQPWKSRLVVEPPTATLFGPALPIGPYCHQLSSSAMKPATFFERQTLATTASARANSAGSISKPEAAAFSSSCSGRVAPTIADATFGSRSIHAKANCDIVQPASCAIGFSRSTLSRTSGRNQLCII